MLIMLNTTVHAYIGVSFSMPCMHVTFVVSLTLNCFIQLINHGVSETLMDKMLRASQRFFDLSEEEKREYAGGKVLDPIRYGTSFNLMVDKALFWRDYLKCHVHPHFNVPSKPHGFRYHIFSFILLFCAFSY